MEPAMKFATSLEVAKSFGKYQDEALAEEAIAVTRYGRPTVVIVSYVEYERLAAGQPTRRREAHRAEDMPDDLLSELDRVIDDVERRVDGREPADAPARA
jgi:prevent-host-death family protein